MTSSRLYMLVALPLMVLALVLAGCGSDEGNEGAAGVPETTQTAGAEGDSGSDDGEGGGGEFTQEQLNAIQETEISGYTRQQPVAGFGGLSMGYDSDATGLTASVTVQACDPFICWDLDLAVTPEHEESLRSNLSAVHIENPDLVFEYGNVQVAPGYEAFFTYSRSYVPNDSGASWVNGYQTIYHDDSNIVLINVSPGFSSESPDSMEAVAAQMDQAQGEAAAQEVFAAFAGHFEAVE